MKCSKCSLDKDINDFHKNKKQCKTCSKEYSRIYRLNNLEKCKNNVISYQLKNKEKVRDYNIEYQKTHRKEYYEKNKDSIIKRTKSNYYKKRESRLEVSKIYQKNNRPKKNAYKRRYMRERSKIDPLFKLSNTIRSLIKNSFKNNGFTKKSNTFKILQCEFIEFKVYIESQFREGMTWDNHGEWHLDHKIPISWATSVEEIIKLNHFSNFQPLWANENLSKGNRYED